MNAPVLLPQIVIHVNGDLSSCAQVAPAAPATSLPKDFPHQAHADVLGRGRPFDPHAYRRAFPDRFAAFLRANFQSVEHAAVFFNVTYRTAENWYEGNTRATGDKVAMAAMSFPQSFRDIMGDAA